MGEAINYKPLENIIQKINADHIALSPNETKIYQSVMNQIKDILIHDLKQDALFAFLFTDVYYAGSYFDRLKVGKAEEFDLNIVFTLPKIIRPRLEPSDVPAFVHLMCEKREDVPKTTDFEKIDEVYRKLFKNNNRLDVTTFFSWIQAKMDGVFNKYIKNNSIEIPITLSGKSVTVRIKRLCRAPAYTMNLKTYISGVDVNVDVDFAPCIRFGIDQWPSNFRRNPSNKIREILVVPKMPHNTPNKEQYWRLSFHAIEAEIIKGHERMKPAIKLLKKLRDHNQHDAISSYYIKTVFLLQTDEVDATFWKQSLANVFMQMLRKLADMVLSEKIPYYWNTEFNMIGHLDPNTCASFGNRLRSIVADVDRNLYTDPFTIARYLVSPSDVLKLREGKPLEVEPTTPTTENENSSRCLLM